MGDRHIAALAGALAVANRLTHDDTQSAVGALRPGSPEILFASIASAAENFRSTCGSERGAPECSKQGSPGATPHVGQVTENNCFAVRSLFLIWIRCDKTSRKSVPYSTPFATGIGVRFPLSAAFNPLPIRPLDATRPLSPGTGSKAV